MCIRQDQEARIRKNGLRVSRPIPYFRSKAIMLTMTLVQYDPEISCIFELFLDFMRNFPHIFPATLKTNTQDD